jgi:uncharacterized protein YkwD
MAPPRGTGVAREWGVPFLRALLCLAIAAPAAFADDAMEARVLAEINLARTEPQAYARIVAAAVERQHTAAGRSAALEAVRHLEKMKPLPALKASPGLSAAAALHVADAGPRGARGHRGSGFSTPWSRMDRFGRRYGTGAENIAYGARDARSIVLMQLIDAGVRSRGHRKNLLSPHLGVAGVAYGPHASYGTMCVIDFATLFVERTAEARPLAAR